MKDDKDKHSWAEAWQRFSVWYTERYYKRAYSMEGMVLGFVFAMLFIIVSALLR